MRKIAKFLIAILVLTSCSDAEDEVQDNGIEAQNLVGTWVASSLQFDFNGDQIESIIGKTECGTGDVSQLPLSNGCSGTEVEQCQTREEFSITFEDIGTYTRLEYDTKKNAQVDAENNCRITYFENDSFKSSAKGFWSMNENGKEILLEESYALIELVNFGEDYSREDYDESDFVWKILSLTDGRLKIFWRTPDQFDLEISFDRKN